MSTEKTLQRSETNRRNAQSSTGPRNTTSTRYNAAKHGLLAAGVTELDDLEHFRCLALEVRSQFQPVGPVEDSIVRQIILCLVRLRRAAALEAEYITSCLNPPITETRVVRKGEHSEFFASMSDVTETVVVDPGIPMRLGSAIVENLTNTFHRYEATIENRLQRNLNMLERLQRLRNGEKVSAPVNLEVTVNTPEAKLASFGSEPLTGAKA